MKISNNIRHRMLFILHRAFIEIRLLSQAGKHQQIFDLADAIEPLPAMMASWKDEHIETIRSYLETYTSKYPDAFRYIDFIDKYDPPPF